MDPEQQMYNLLPLLFRPVEVISHRAQNQLLVRAPGYSRLYTINSSGTSPSFQLTFTISRIL